MIISLPFFSIFSVLPFPSPLLSLLLLTFRLCYKEYRYGRPRIRLGHFHCKNAHLLILMMVMVMMIMMMMVMMMMVMMVMMMMVLMTSTVKMHTY
jgi:hypothetical protein